MRNILTAFLYTTLTFIAASTASCTDTGVSSTPINYGTIGNLAMVSSAQSRAITAENLTGEPGKAAAATEGTGKNASRELGVGWKVSPSIVIKAKTTAVLADMSGPGTVTHIWMTVGGNAHPLMLRAYWDGQTDPAVECPYCHFFACALHSPCSIASIAVCVNPQNACNCYWPMPFRRGAKFTMENTGEKDVTLYYQVDYTLADVQQHVAYFHVQYRHADPIGPDGIYTILDGVHGQGQYVGTYLTWQPRAPGWWGEGEVKFFIDGDRANPTICGTGTEDYFCGSYDFEDSTHSHYQTFSSPYSGLAQVAPPDTIYKANQQLGMYRWHIVDPIRYTKNLKVTIQALGWQANQRYRIEKEDAASSAAFWYQSP